MIGENGVMVMIIQNGVFALLVLFFLLLFWWDNGLNYVLRLGLTMAFSGFGFFLFVIFARGLHQWFSLGFHFYILCGSRSFFLCCICSLWSPFSGYTSPYMG